MEKENYLTTITNQIIAHYGYEGFILPTAICLAFIYFVFFFLPLKGKAVYKLGYPDDRKIFFRTKNWIEYEAKVLRFDYSNSEGSNPVSKKELSNFTKEAVIDSVVMVVEYQRSTYGKTTKCPVTVFTNNKPYQIGDIVKIKVNPQEPLEAFII